MSNRDLREMIEPLVDAISQLVLSAVTSSLDEVKKSCEDIAKYTRGAVEIAKDNAIASQDVDIQVDITKAINDIADAINKLVVSFHGTINNPSKEAQKTFAKAAKDTGDAINALLISADNTYLRKITEAVNLAKQSNITLKQQAPISREALTTSAQACSEKSVSLVKIAMKAADATIDDNKGKLLRGAAERVKALAPEIIIAAKGTTVNPNDRNAADKVDQKYSELCRVYDQLIEYAKMTANYIGKVNEAWEQAQRLLELARNMEEAARLLKEAALSGDHDRFMDAARRHAQVAQDLIAQATRMAESEKDPLKKAMLLSAIDELRIASKNLLEAAAEANKDPKNPEKIKRLENAHQILSDAIAKVLALTDPDQSPASRFYYAADFVEKTAGHVVDDGKRANKPKLVDDAETLAAAALHFVHEARGVADTLLDPKARQHLLDLAGEVKTGAHGLSDQAKKVSNNPNDQKEVNELDRRYHDLQSKLDEARKAAGFHVSRNITPSGNTASHESNQSNIEFLKGESDLVIAAKQEAVEALKIAEEAEKFAQEVKDPKKKQEILDAASELRGWANKVIAAAEDVSRNPNDLGKQQFLIDTQKELGKSIAKVIGLTSEAREELQKALRELEALLAESEGLFNDLLAACKNAQDQVQQNFVENSGRRAPTELVSNAKKLADISGTISKLLKEIGAKTNDPVFKNQLNQAAGIIRDRAIQVKMISAVKVAMTGDEVDDNQVVSAAKGVSSEVADIVKSVRAGMLKRRVQHTQQQTLAIKRIRELWNQGRQKQF